MAEATINPGGVQPPTPPGVPTLAGNVGATGVPANTASGPRPLPTAVQVSQVASHRSAIGWMG